MYDKNIDYVLPVEREDVNHKKKKLSKKLTVTISLIACLVIAGGVLLNSFLTPKTIEGSWELVVNPEIAEATADQIEDKDRVYYVFEKPNQYGQGEYKTIFDGGIEHYDYELSEDNGVEKVNLGASDLEYKITGSKMLGNAKMVITLPAYTDEQTGQKSQAQEYVFKQEKAPDYEKESYDDFDIDSKLISEWATNERSVEYYMYSLPYTQTVTFNDNGIMTIHYESEDLALDRYMYYAYSAKDKSLTFSLVTDKDTKYTVKYDFDENGNLIFVDDKTSGSIFADAFFGEFTYYTPENLPEPTNSQVIETTVE